MKRIQLALLFLTMTLAVNAQGKNYQEQERFSPEKFEAELHDFIVNEAHLNSQEEAKFFPLYREMQQKQRTIFNQQRALSKQKPQSEEACRKAIQERNEKEIELKCIQQDYHKRFLELLPASKVWDILKAEERFHRRAMKNWSQPRHPQGQNPRKRTNQK